MLVKYGLDALASENTSYSVTLVPRLNFSIDLLSSIIEILQEQRIELKNLNKHLIIDFDEFDQSHLKSLKLEQMIVFSLDILFQIKSQIDLISGIQSIPEILPSSIPMIRTVSAQLFVVSPISSQKLSELSVCLGSIVLDSAVLTQARFDFSKSNEKYPIVDFFKLSNV
ncbi:MAG: hypothetical protein CXT78_16415 [Thaumarchaeota archaeon]|nr:MAG: hypothetical protein CXT78_16415 [Nitrososphaerota archaeon]